MKIATLLWLTLAACGDKDESAPPVDDSDGPADADGDGYTADVDCADEIAEIHPDAVEICDNVDQDCDGATDEDASDASPWYQDGDGDGYGLPGSEVLACAPPSGFVAQAGDCDDAALSTRPGAVDTCNGVDDNCDGLIDENDLYTWHRDRDGDGWGSGRSLESCLQPEGYAFYNGDCDDDEPLVNPGLTEQCDDGLDNDCDGTDNGCSLSGRLTADAAQAILSGPATDAYLGYALAYVGDVSGDGVGDLLVGAPYMSYASGAYDYAGRAYLVSGSVSGEWTIDAVDQAQIIGLEGDYLGISVGGGFDFSSDGFNDIVVGATYASDGNDGIGAVYVFEGPLNGAVIPSRAFAALYGDSATSYFAEAMATTADVTGDAWADIAVSDTFAYDASSGDYTGAVYVFHGPTRGSVDVARARATLRGAGSYAYFGQGLADLGDQNGDGQGDLVVGSPGLTFGGASQRGGVSVFDGPLSGTYQVTDASANVVGRYAYDSAGGRVAGVGDLNDDGYGDLAFTVTGHDISYGDEGAVLVMHGPLSGTLGAADVDAIVEGVEANAGLGTNVSGGDLNNDGVIDLLIGCFSCTGTSSYSGVQYAVYGPISGTVPVDRDLQIVGETSYGYMGYQAVMGDLDADGLNDIAVSEVTYSSSSMGYVGRVLTFVGQGL